MDALEAVMEYPFSRSDEPQETIEKCDREEKAVVKKLTGRVTNLQSRLAMRSAKRLEDGTIDRRDLKQQMKEYLKQSITSQHDDHLIRDANCVFFHTLHF